MVEYTASESHPSHGADTVLSFMSVSQLWHLYCTGRPSSPNGISDKVRALAQATCPNAVYSKHCSSSESLGKQSLAYFSISI